MDAIYTPARIAQFLTKHVTRRVPKIIADFAVGDGELLRAAAGKWQSARFFGSDIDKNVIGRLSSMHPAWTLTHCDFLDRKARNGSRCLRAIKGKVGLALLNPPFSHRGAHRWEAELDGTTINCSQGLAFVVTSLSYLAPRGEVIAILPAGSLHSEMDESAWAFVDQFCERLVLGVNGDTTFPGCLPKTFSVKLRLRRKRRSQRLIKAGAVHAYGGQPNPKCLITVERGKVDMPSLNGTVVRGGIPLVHTTELNRSGINLIARKAFRGSASVHDHAVLIPRVGRPDPSKVCLCPRGGPIALSNCVIAMKCKSAGDATTLHTALIRRWSDLQGIYSGTCAQYITIKRLRNFLHLLGFVTNYRAPQRAQRNGIHLLHRPSKSQSTTSPPS